MSMLKRPMPHSSASKEATSGNFTQHAMIGQVLSNADPMQELRLKVYIPNVDMSGISIDNLPWCQASLPFCGHASDLVVGREVEKIAGIHTYGMWGTPLVGSQVLVMFIGGDPSKRVWVGCLPPPQIMSNLAGGKNTDFNGKSGKFTEDDKPLTGMLRHAANAGLSDDNTRGPYERQVSDFRDPADPKLGSDGYHVNLTDKTSLYPASYGIATPGRHYLYMSDAPDWCRVRIKTTAGNQIILDDTNERIYMSTADGNTYVELDENGKIHIYGADDINLHSLKNINIAADGMVNIEGKNGVNIKSGGDLNLDGNTINVSSASALLLTSCGNTDILSSGHFVVSCTDIGSITALGDLMLDGSSLQLGVPGPEATCASNAASPNTTPQHEPWTRPENDRTRNSYWKAS